MINKKLKQNILLPILRVVLIVLIILIVYLLFFHCPTIPYLFSVIYGKTFITQTLNGIISDTNDSDDIALAVMDWEKEYLYNPYSLYNPNSTLQKYGIYKINGTYKWFYRNVPVSWIIYSRLANCEEYAKVFVYLMDKKEVRTRFLHAPGEDHAWAQYISDGFKVTVNPSANEVILDKKKFAEGNNWSYIESVDICNTSDIRDVSHEYIKRGKLSVSVFKNSRPVENAKVILKSPYLMRTQPKRYKKPKIVLINKTNKEGVSTFKLGGKQYIVEVKDSYFLFHFLYSKNITVFTNQEVNLSFDLDKDERTIKFFD